MERIVSASAAWADFWERLKSSPEWHAISRKEKQYLHKTDLHVREGVAGANRLLKTFERYAPGRYRLEQGFVITEV